MAEREDATEVSFFVRDENALSPEDLAWVDSCLTNVPEDSDSNSWETLREALIEVIDNHHEMFLSSSTRTMFSVKDEDMAENELSDQPTFGEEADSMSCNGPSTEDVSEILSLLTFEPDPSKNSLQDNNVSTPDPMDNIDVTEDVEGTEIGSASGEEAEPESVLSKIVKDDLMGTSIQDNVAEPFSDFNVSEDDIKLSSRDIFRVWDLQIPVDENEEDEFERQLKKALNESSKERPPPQPLDDDDDDAVVQENGNVDDLIAGISDLSLTESFS